MKTTPTHSFLLALALAAVFALPAQAADATKLTIRPLYTLYDKNGNTKGHDGGWWIGGLFDGDFDSPCVYENGAGNYFIIDFTKDSNFPGGCWVTDIYIGHKGDTKYTLQYKVDGEWVTVPGANAVQQAQSGKVRYPVNALAKQVKYIFTTVSNWSQSLAEIEIWGMDPADVECQHPESALSPWTPVAGSATCTTPGYEIRTCQNCGEIIASQTSASLPPLGHDYSNSVIRAGTAAGYGSGTITCSRCDFEIDFSDGPCEMMQFGGVATEGRIQFVDLSVSSTGDTGWGVNASRLINNSWVFDEWHDWHAITRSHDEFIQIEFGTTVDLTKIEFAVANHNQTVEFWNCDGAEEVKMGEVAVKTDSSVGEFIAQRKTIYFTGDDQTTGQAVKKLRVRFTDTEGLGVKGTRPVSMGEIHPYGTVVGAGKKDPGKPMFLLMQ